MDGFSHPFFFNELSKTVNRTGHSGWLSVIFSKLGVNSINQMKVFKARFPHKRLKNKMNDVSFHFLVTFALVVQLF